METEYRRGSPMTDDEINIALAKWDEWKFQQGEEPVYGGQYTPTGWFNPQGVFLFGKDAHPSYTTSLNALAPLEPKLTEEQNRIYAQQILIVLGIRNVTSDGRLINGSDLCAEDWMKCVRATAAQKARALVRALGLDGREG